MPRQRRSAAPSAPRRPAVAPARPNVTPPQPQNRPATTLAGPGTQMHQGQAKSLQQGSQQQQGPGLFGQMASTAAGVAVGSSIGHAIGGFFGGGGAQPADQANTAATAYDQAPANTANNTNSWGAPSCEADARQFTRCLDEHGGNMQICGWYLEQLKACQQAASQY